MAGRRKGRILAFQALFAWEANKMSLSELLEFNWLEEDRMDKFGEDGIAFPV